MPGGRVPFSNLAIFGQHIKARLIGTSELAVVKVKLGTGAKNCLGSIAGTLIRATKAGKSVGWAHLRYLNPMPKNLGEILSRYEKVVVPELNLGQLVNIIRAQYGVPAIPMNKVQGRPFTTAEIEEMVDEHLA